MKRLLVCTSLVFAFLGAGTAQATMVTVGSPLTNPALAPTAFTSPITLSQATLPGANVVAPFNGTIVRWRVIGASGGPLKLRVVHPLGGALFTGAGTATSGPITGPGVLTFTANLPIRAGDRIGVDPTAGADTIGGDFGLPGAAFNSWNPPLADAGAGRAPDFTGTAEVGLNATVDSNCIVPSVLRLALAAASAVIEAANCDLGAVTKPKKKKKKKKKKKAAQAKKKKKKKQKLVVRSQSPAAGTEVPAGTDVALKLGTKKKKKKKKK